MKPQTGILLRLLGPMLQLFCAATLMRSWGEGRTFLGIQLDSLLMLGFLVGLTMVVLGLTMVRKPGRGAKSSALDLDLDRDRT